MTDSKLWCFALAAVALTLLSGTAFLTRNFQLSTASSLLAISVAIFGLLQSSEREP